MIGSDAIISGFSYVAIGRETTWGTYATCTSGINVMSMSPKTIKESKVLEEIVRSRTYTDRISLSKKIEGEAEFYFRPDVTACSFILENAFGGSVTSTAVTAGASYSHDFLVGSMDLTSQALSFNVRKGDATKGQVFEYKGGRVNELTVMSELDEAIKMTTGLIFKDSSLTANDLESSITIPVSDPFTFVGGRFSTADSLASLTASSYWHVQNIEFKISNNLKADNESRRIGSDVLDVLPPGVATFELKVSMRWDTTTAYDAMINGTAMMGEFEFLGETLTGSNQRRSLTFEFPKLYVNDAGDPEIGGPDEIMKSDVVFDVLRDASSATGYACKAILVNGIATI